MIIKLQREEITFFLLGVKYHLRGSFKDTEDLKEQRQRSISKDGVEGDGTQIRKSKFFCLVI